jgi:hypothetical protein
VSVNGDAPGRRAITASPAAAEVMNIFISHASEQRVFAEPIALALRGKALEVFLDRSQLSSTSHSTGSAKSLRARMWGHDILPAGGSLKEANEYFSQALTSPLERAYVRRMHIAALLWRRGPNMENEVVRPCARHFAAVVLLAPRAARRCCTLTVRARVRGRPTGTRNAALRSRRAPPPHGASTPANQNLTSGRTLWRLPSRP